MAGTWENIHFASLSGIVSPHRRRVAAKKDTRLGVYFGLGGGTVLLSSGGSRKHKMASRGAVKDRWGLLNPLWHVCACVLQIVTSRLDSVRFVSEGSTWRVGRVANDCFLHFLLGFHERRRLGIRWRLWVGWWNCDWQIPTADLAAYMRLQTRWESTYLISWKLKTSKSSQQTWTLQQHWNMLEAMRRSPKSSHEWTGKSANLRHFGIPQHFSRG